LRDLIHDGVMSVEWTGTGNMGADGLTKALNWTKFDDFVKKVGLCRIGESGFRGSVEVNPDHGWTLVEGGKKRNLALQTIVLLYSLSWSAVRLVEFP
jgi:hypothetical protein